MLKFCHEKIIGLAITAVLLMACRGSPSIIWQDDGFIRVAGGTFYMGSPEGTPNSLSDERPVRAVTISTFYMSKFPVTQGEFYDLMGWNPSRFRGERTPAGADWRRLPVEMVGSWYTAIQFANRKSELAGLTLAYEGGYGSIIWNRKANGYRLPTEAEWEFAARGGTLCHGNFIFSGSDDFNEVAWIWANSRNRTREVGSLRPNALGIYDMSGNVWEWVWDWYGPYIDIAEIDPLGYGPSFSRVLRGGSHMSSPNSARARNRYYCETRNRAYPECRQGPVGFRLVRSDPSFTS